MFEPEDFDLMMIDDEGDIQLHLAAEYGYRHVLRELLEAQGAAVANAVNSTDKYGNSVLMWAVIGGSVECVELVFNNGGMMNQTDRQGRTPLMGAVRGGHDEVVEYLVNNFNEKREGLSFRHYINMRDEDERTAIHFAVSEGHSRFINYLIRKGGDPLIRDHYGGTPFHYAALRKHPDALDALLEGVNMADRADAVNSKDINGDTVLMCAVLGGCLECVVLVMNNGGIMTESNNEQSTVLMVSILTRNLAIVSYLLRRYNLSNLISLEHFINMEDEEGKTACHFAAMMGLSDVLQELLDLGGDPLCRTKNKCTPLHYAALFTHPGALRVLLANVNETGRADAVNSRSRCGNSVWMCADLGRCRECVDLCMEAGGYMRPMGVNTTLLKEDSMNDVLKVWRYMSRKLNTARY